MLRQYTIIVLLLLVAMGGCDGGGAATIDDEFIAFSPIPECVAEYFLDNPTGCDCKGEQFEFGMELRRVEPDGNVGTIIGRD